MWKRSRSWKSAASAIADRLDHLGARAPARPRRRTRAPRRRAAGRARAAAPRRPARPRRASRSTNTPTISTRRRSAARDAGGDGRVGRARRARPEDEAERPRTELDGELGVLGTGDAADLDARHARKRSGTAPTVAYCRPGATPRRGRSVGQRRLRARAAMPPRVRTSTSTDVARLVARRGSPSRRPSLRTLAAVEPLEHVAGVQARRRGRASRAATARRARPPVAGAIPRCRGTRARRGRPPRAAGSPPWRC